MGQLLELMVVDLIDPKGTTSGPLRYTFRLMVVLVVSSVSYWLFR